MTTTTSRTGQYRMLMGALAFTVIFTITAAFSSGGIGNKYATMNVVEYMAGVPGYDSKIIIVYEDSKTEEILLEKVKPSTQVANKIKINEALNGMLAKGYELKFIDSGSYIFTKN